MTALSPFRRPAALARAALVVVPLAVATGLAAAGFMASRSLPKARIAAMVRALPKNAALAARGVERRVVAMRLAGVAREVPVVCTRVASTAAPRRDRPPQPPLLFLAPVPGTAWEWAPVMMGDGLFDGAIDAGRAMVALEVLGSGFGPDALGPLSVDAAVDYLLGCLDALELPRVAVVARGFSAEVAWRAAARAPDRFERLILMTPTAGEPAPDGGPYRGSRGYLTITADAVGRELRSWLVASPYDDAIVDDTVSEAALVLQNADSWEAQRSLAARAPSPPPPLSVPTLLLWGGLDSVVPRQRAEALRVRASDSRLLTFERNGHLPHVEDPEAVAAAIVDFLR